MMRITVRVMLGNLLIGILPILLSLLLVLFILDRQSRSFVDNTMQSTLDGVKNYIQADQQKYSDFSLFLRGSLPLLDAESSLSDYKYQLAVNIRGESSINRMNIRFYEVFYSNMLVLRETYSWKDNPYFIQSAEAETIWNRLLNPLYQRWQVISIPVPVTNILVVRHCTIIEDSGLKSKMGFLALSVPIDREYLSGIPMPGADATVFVTYDSGGIIGNDEFQRDDVMASLRETEKSKDGKTYRVMWKNLGTFYVVSSPLFSDQVKVSRRTVQREIARVGVIYNAKALVQDVAILRRTIIFVFFFGMAAIGGLAFLVARTVIRPIRRLNGMVDNFRSRFQPIEPPEKLEDELSYLHESFSEMSAAIIKQTEELRSERNRLHQRNDDMEKELEMAMRIQRRIIPTHSPFREIAFSYIPMEKVGGDFYDIIRIRESECDYGIFVSDVSGHGVPAAFITSMIKSMILQAGDIRRDPALLLQYLNRLLIDNTDGNFVTAFYAVYSRETRTLQYANAGHNLPFLIRADGVSQVKVARNGTPLAILSSDELHVFGRDYANQTLNLEPDSKLLFFTDGLTEAVRENDAAKIKKDFEESLLLEIMYEYRNLSSERFIAKLVDELIAFRGSDRFDDDVALICLSVD